MRRHLEEPSITFVQEITKHLFPLKDEIKHYLFNDGDALTLGIHSLLSLKIYQWEQVNKKNSLICNAMKVHRRSLKILRWPTSG